MLDYAQHPLRGRSTRTSATYSKCGFAGVVRKEARDSVCHLAMSISDHKMGAARPWHVYPLGLWSRSSGVVKVLYGYG